MDVINYIKSNIEGLGLSEVSWPKYSSISSYDLSLLSAIGQESLRASNTAWASYGWSKVGNVIQSQPGESLATLMTRCSPGDIVVSGDNHLLFGSTSNAKLFVGPTGLVALVNGAPVKVSAHPVDNYFLDLSVGQPSPTHDVVVCLEVSNNITTNTVYPKGNMDFQPVTDSSVPTNGASKTQTVYRVVSNRVTSYGSGEVSFSVEGGSAAYPVPGTGGAAYKATKQNGSGASTPVTLFPIALLKWDGNETRPIYVSKNEASVFPGPRAWYKGRAYSGMVLDLRTSYTVSMSECAKSAQEALMAGVHHASFPSIQAADGSYSTEASTIDTVFVTENWLQEQGSSSYRMTSSFGEEVTGPYVFPCTSAQDVSISDLGSLDLSADSYEIVPESLEYYWHDGVNSGSTTSGSHADIKYASASIRSKSHRQGKAASTAVSHPAYVVVSSGPSTGYKVPIEGSRLPLRMMAYQTTGTLPDSLFLSANTDWDKSYVTSSHPGASKDKSAGVVASIFADTSTLSNIFVLKSSTLFNAEILNIKDVYLSTSGSTPLLITQVRPSGDGIEITLGSTVPSGSSLRVELLLDAPVVSVSNKGIKEVFKPSKLSYSSAGALTGWEFLSSNQAVPVSSFAVDHSGNVLGKTALEYVRLNSSSARDSFGAYPLTDAAINMASPSFSGNALRAPLNCGSLVTAVSVIGFIRVFAKDSGSIGSVSVVYSSQGYRRAPAPATGSFKILSHVGSIASNYCRSASAPASQESYGGFVMASGPTKHLFVFQARDEKAPSMFMGIIGADKIVRSGSLQYAPESGDKLYGDNGLSYEAGVDILPSLMHVVVVRQSVTGGPLATVNPGDSFSVIQDQLGMGVARSEITIMSEGLSAASLPSSGYTINAGGSGSIVVRTLPLGTVQYDFEEAGEVLAADSIISLYSSEQKVSAPPLIERLPSSVGFSYYGDGESITMEADGVQVGVPSGFTFVAGFGGSAYLAKGVVGVAALGADGKKSPLVFGKIPTSFTAGSRAMVYHFMAVQPSTSNKAYLGVVAFNCAVSSDQTITLGRDSMSTAAFDLFEMPGRPLVV